MVFQQYLFEKAHFIAKMSGLAMVWPWSGHGLAMVWPWSGRPVLTFGKRPKILQVMEYLHITVSKGFLREKMLRCKTCS